MDRTLSEAALDQRARRIARSADFVATKSRWRIGHPENQGGFMIRDSSTMFPVAGWTYDYTAEDVVAWCKSDSPC